MLLFFKKEIKGGKMKNTTINFSGSFIGYMNSIFPEISLSDIIEKTNTNIKKNLNSKNEDFNEYKIIFGNNFYGYEHALKVSIEKKGKKKINEVMIQDLFSDKEKSILKLSEMD
jgi:hypothetical protein